MSYDPDFDFNTSPDITVPCAYSSDQVSEVCIGRPPSEPEGSGFHVTLFVQEQQVGSAANVIKPCPLFTDEEAGSGITVHVYVTHQDSSHTHKKKTGSVPTGYIGGSVPQ